MPTTKELTVKENGKLYSRARALLSKENRISGENTCETSFRVYYGATGAAVPFMWESQPGTPKHPIFSKNRDNGNDDYVPPLTPPPSYTTSSMTLGNISRKRRKSRIFDVFFSSMSRKSCNSDVTPTSSLSSPLSWSTTSSSSSSSLSSPRLGGRKSNKGPSHRRSVSFCSFGAKSPLFGDEEDHKSVGSPNSSAIMCFGFNNKKKTYQGCYSMQDMKNAVLSIRGHLKN